MTYASRLLDARKAVKSSVQQSGHQPSAITQATLSCKSGFFSTYAREQVEISISVHLRVKSILPEKHAKSPGTGAAAWRYNVSFAPRNTMRVCKRHLPDECIQETSARYRTVEPSNGSNVILRLDRPGLAGLGPHTTNGSNSRRPTGAPRL